MVIAPASTGRDDNNKIVEISIDRVNKGVRSNCVPSLRILVNVLIKFTTPKMGEITDKCKEKIAKSTDGPE